MLLGIVLHAAITYMDRRMDGLLWPVQTQTQPTHVGFDLLFWWIHGWRIPLFFVMAGFFAAMLARRRGAGGFFKHRVDRILKPIAVATVTLLPLLYFIFAWGWVVEGRASWEEVLQADFDDAAIENHFLGPAHLWFLNYLFIFSLVYWLILKVFGSGANVGTAAEEPKLGKRFSFFFNSALRPLWFAVPTAGFLAVDPGLYTGYHHIVPKSWSAAGYELVQLIYNGWFFVVGVYLFRLHREMDALKRNAWLYLVLAHLAFLVLIVLMTGTNQRDPGALFDPANRWYMAVSVSLFCWLMIWGLTGIGLTLLARPSALVRWLSDSAYWVYLIHLPIVAVLMVVMRDWPIGGWGRFVMIVMITSVLTLASYQWGVRYTVIGRWLNGPRTRPKAS